MLEYDKIEVYEWTDVSKTDGLLECIICNYWYFGTGNINFTFHPQVCNDCHDLLQKAMSFNDFVLVTIKRKDSFLYMNKYEAINLLRNVDLTEKAEYYKTWKLIITHRNG